MSSKSPRRFLLSVALLAVLSVFGSVGAVSAAAYATPTGLRVTAVSANTVDLAWNAVSNAPRYRIQMATNSDMSNAVYFRVTPNQRQMTGLKSSTKYYFKVRVITAEGGNLSPYSSAVSATTTMPSPGGLRATAHNEDSVSLAWNAVTNAPRYRIQMSTSPTMSGATYYRVTPPSRVMTGLTPGTTYYFKVRVITDEGVNLSPYSAAISVTTTVQPPPPTSEPLRIGSFNVKCANCFSNLPEEGTWVERRASVVSTIIRQAPDVLGIQEASQGWLKGTEISQFEDLRNRLKAAGGNYQLANSHRNNCVKSTTPSSCSYKDQGASKGTKVYFNADTVELISQGSKRLESACGGCNERYVAWAILRQKSTGKKIFFADTHLEPTPTYAAKRIIQTRQMIAEIAAKNTEKLPVFAVGDFNSTRYQTPSNAPYDQMIASGLVDPLGQTYKSAKVSSLATAEKRIHANYNTYNDFRRAQTFYGVDENGSALDYIFTSPMRVTEWETVVTVDSAGKLAGRIPSDHNMLRATVLLP